MRLPRLQRYGPTARWYDAVSFERPVYRAGRVRGIALLGLRPGDRVVDIGCGTGLNFPLLREAVGPTGRVIGVDASATMLAGARRRITAHGWSNVELRHGDAADLSVILDPDPLFDAALFTYALSVIDHWQAAYTQTTRRVRDGGRLLVVDLALPTGRWRALSPLAQLACCAGGSDWRRAPWTLPLGTLAATSHSVLRGGHIHVAAGTVTARPG